MKGPKSETDLNVVAFLNVLIAATHCSQNQAKLRWIDEFESRDTFNT